MLRTKSSSLLPATILICSRSACARANGPRGREIGPLRLISGRNFDDFLKEEGFFEEVQAKALKRVVSEQIEDSMLAANLTKVAMAKKMATSRSQLARVLDPNNLSIQLDTLIKAARAVGKVVEIKIKRA